LIERFMSRVVFRLVFNPVKSFMSRVVFRLVFNPVKRFMSRVVFRLVFNPVEIKFEKRKKLEKSIKNLIINQ